MASIKEQIQDDLKIAMKARQQPVVTTLRCLLAAVKQVEVDKRIDLGEAEVSAILLQEQKKRRDALKFAQQQNREDLIKQNSEELELMQKYLGQPLTSQELEKLVRQAVAGGADNISKVMAVLNKEYKGRFEGKAASDLCRAVLAGTLPPSSGA